ncbi:MAG: hypothetical protein IJY25_05185 [Bacilli bacterium]|nr:hypothetical protein [Bacilli bacterium]
MKDSPIKIFIIVVVLLSIFTGAYLLIKHFIEDDSLEYEEYLKNYEVNEYIATYVTDEDMARRYLNDYIHNMYFDIEYAYSLLDEEYRNKKFGSLESYKNYVYSLTYSTYQMERYYKTSKDGYLIFGVYDNNGNIFIFKTKGVMQYKVYLDDYTVEI